MDQQINLIDEIEELLSKAYKLSKEDLSQAISLTEKALFKTQKIKNKSEVHANSMNQLAILQKNNKELSTAKNLADRALTLSFKIDYDQGIGDAEYNLATILFQQKKYSEALPHILEAIHYYEKCSKHNFLAKSTCLLGSIYEEFQDYKNASTAYDSALKIIETHENKPLLSDIYLSIAGLNLKIGKISKASLLIDKSIALKIKLKQKEKLAKAHYLRGKIQLNDKNTHNAESSFKKALAIYNKVENNKGIVECMEKLGEIYYIENKITESIHILEVAVDICLQEGFNDTLYKCHHRLFQCNKATDNARALYHLEEYVHYKKFEDEKYVQNLVEGYEVISQLEDIEKDAEIEQERASIIEKKNTELDSFFYRVSHDLKGPIASLLGLSDLVDKDIKDEQARHFFKMYDNQIRRLNKIVMELINITELNYRDIQLTLINFYEIVENCISAYSYAKNYDRINFSIDIQSNIYYKSEWYIINTIFQNLIENSIKYVDEEKSEFLVQVSVFRNKKNIIFQVKDNGKGIAEEHHHKIFDMFYRASEDSSGTGLGLFILKRAVERLKGEVKFKSKIGEGSTFQVFLPHHKENNN